MHYIIKKNVHNNPLYNDITINEHWHEICEAENPNLWEHLTNEESDNFPETLTENQNSNSTQNSVKNKESEKGEEDEDTDEDNNDETIHNKLSGLPYDTCIQPKDLTTDTDFLLSLAPGEGKKPLSIHTDKHGEEMSFPHLFPSEKFGFDAARPKKMTLKQYFKNRILNCDNRFSSNIEYLFYAQYRCEAKEVSDCLSIAMRWCNGKASTNKQLTAADVKNTERLRQLTRNDLNF